MQIAALLLPLLCFNTPTQEDLEAIVRFPDGTTIICEIADTQEEHAIGFSRHESLSPDRGMLFIYQKDEWLSFWMPPEMRFNLDIIFLDSEWKVIHIAHDVPPCKKKRVWDCPSYGPEDRPGRFVVEILGGTASKIGLKTGDKIFIELPKDYKLRRTY